jgi:uncharacterized membrane protein YfcA
VIEFPVSGVTTYWWLPIVVALVISCCTSMGGVSGAFLLLPFQVSILGFSGPAVSPTNLIFNIVAIPSGVYRYHREGRMVWPLAVVMTVGTLPGIFLGAVIRVKYFPDPVSFKFFAGLVLLYIGIRLLHDVIRGAKGDPEYSVGSKHRITESLLSASKIMYGLGGNRYAASCAGVSILSFCVGVVGGIYGIGGGAIIAPFLITAFRLPVHTIAGATLTATFAASIAGVIFYTLMALSHSDPNLAIAPDWGLGALLGIGGAAGMYIGARIQKFVPAAAIKIVLAVCMLFIAARYVTGFFGV